MRVPVVTPNPPHVRCGIALVGHIDGTQHMEGGFVDRMKSCEQVKAACGDRFDGAVAITRAGKEKCHAMGDEPVWRGRKKYVITPSRSRSIDSGVVASTEDAGYPSPEELGHFFGRHMRPFRTNIAYFTGHGGGDTVGGMLTAQMGDALQTAREVSGEKPQILFLEACAMGHLDGLRAFHGKAGVALVTEETIPQDALPFNEMMLEACRSGGSPREIAASMVRAAAGKRGVRTFAAVDLDKIEPLGKAVDRLKALLAPQMENEACAQSVRRAVKQSYYCLPVARQFRFGDLGEFLKSLAKGEFTPETQQGVAEAAKLLDEAVFEKTTGPNYYGVSGLSFDTRIGDRSYSWQDLIFD